MRLFLSVFGALSRVSEEPKVKIIYLAADCRESGSVMGELQVLQAGRSAY